MAALGDDEDGVMYPWHQTAKGVVTIARHISISMEQQNIIVKEFAGLNTMRQGSAV